MKKIILLCILFLQLKAQEHLSFSLKKSYKTYDLKATFENPRDYLDDRYKHFVTQLGIIIIDKINTKESYTSQNDIELPADCIDKYCEIHFPENQHEHKENLEQMMKNINITLTQKVSTPEKYQYIPNYKRCI
jgi:hypothetical protein